jgi:hypothetical protein
VHFADGSKLILENREDIEIELEWFDTEEVGDAAVSDNLGRKVSLRVEGLRLVRFQLQE